MPARSFRLLLFSLLYFCIVIFVLNGAGFAQKDSGSIVGIVRDPTGAVMANVKVVVTEVDRGTTFNTTTNDQGEYVASPLRIGRYTVAVEKPGFKKSISEPVQVDVQQRVPVNI